MSQKGQPEKTNDARQAAFLVILRENKKLTNFNRTIFCIIQIPLGSQVKIISCDISDGCFGLNEIVDKINVFFLFCKFRGEAVTLLV